MKKRITHLDNGFLNSGSFQLETNLTDFSSASSLPPLGLLTFCLDSLTSDVWSPLDSLL